jgi:pyrimidine-nucleoside phosphorylase
VEAAGPRGLGYVWRVAADLIPAELIIRKRNGGSLAPDEWAAFFSAYARGEVAEYQVAALLMAIYLQGLSEDETRALTEVMIDSGERWSWDPGSPVGDKHSTGGVGDKVSLVLAPLAAACGVRVPMVSGRGLGHTAGTLDKMESIPNYRTELKKADFDRLLREVGYGMGGQTGSFAPLDRELYALRDVTGTIESVPLITASIMSKKIAEGPDCLVLDVKWGNGAFMHTREEAEHLARNMIGTGRAFGVKTEAVLTDMEAPLGRTVGHALELREAIAMLRGETTEDRFSDVVVALTASLLVLTGVAENDAAARQRIAAALDGGDALERFRLPTPRTAYLAGLPARAVGLALIELGGGRRVKGETIDPRVGFEFPRSIGEQIGRGEPWAIIHAAEEADADAARATLESIVQWSDAPVGVDPVVTARLTAD